MIAGGAVLLLGAGLVVRRLRGVPAVIEDRPGAEGSSAEPAAVPAAAQVA
ncbi:hypothetical protein [Streptacidiphilus rugosus]|nr:hypothetical protein [Streptacidiphilus rugosus]